MSLPCRLTHGKHNVTHGARLRSLRHVPCYGNHPMGEHRIPIEADGIKTSVTVFCHKCVQEIADERCRFIAERQQYNGSIPQLRGAYLAYDNEDECMVYTAENDRNGARERVGMGLLIAAHLQQMMPDSPLRAQLLTSLRFCWGQVAGRVAKQPPNPSPYIAFAAREIVDTSTGEVCNDICKDNSYKRLYNAPWYAALYVELYALFHDKEYLEVACRIVRRFYADGGRDFYTIQMPMVCLCKSLEAAGMESAGQDMRSLFVSHADRLCERGLDFPSSEVNYEQSIVAPACNIMFSAYSLTGEKRYLDMGRKILVVLEMFNGFQGDYHTHEAAVRHWDGYWFGKSHQLGDTFPHYWSALTGVVFKKYALIAGLDTTEGRTYMHRAEDSMRAVLTMIQADGRASCAYIFPDTVNGAKRRFWDAIANDQDWGLYMYIREHGQEKAKR